MNDGCSPKMEGPIDVFEESPNSVLKEEDDEIF
jgi:hypothetical protein